MTLTTTSDKPAVFAMRLNLLNLTSAQLLLLPLLLPLLLLLLWLPTCHGIVELPPAFSIRSSDASIPLWPSVAQASERSSEPSSWKELLNTAEGHARNRTSARIYSPISSASSSIGRTVNYVELAPIKENNFLSDVFISVKTTRPNHRVRLPAILQTWFQLVRQQTFFFTDAEDAEISRASGGHLVVTACPSGHTRQALSCKMNSEFDTFLLVGKKWWCHFDDDNYVNIIALEKSLKSFDASKHWYLGKDSIKTPLHISTERRGNVHFRFATGGAGFCISRALASAMKPYCFDGRLEKLSEELRLPDDVTIGFLVEVVVGAKLTTLPGFHSHLEELRLIQKPLREHISLSYNIKKANFVTVRPSIHKDPTRFLSIHCEIFPEFSSCNRFRKRR